MLNDIRKFSNLFSLIVVPRKVHLVICQLVATVIRYQTLKELVSVVLWLRVELEQYL